MATARIPDQNCPRCAYRLTAATGLTHDETPEALDLTVCIRCGAALVFEPGLRMRLATEEDLRALDGETREEIARLQATVAHVKAARN